MRFSRRVLFAAVLLLLPAAYAGACQCGSIPSVEEALDRAESVFEGRVVDTWPVSFRFDGMAGLGIRTTFRVFSRWKGNVGPEVDLLDTAGNCSFRFHRGETYLVFAQWEGMGLRSTSICTLTRPLAALQPGEYPPGRREIVSGDYSYEPESRAHRFARRLTLAALAARGNIEWRWGSLGDDPAGVRIQLACRLAGVAALVLLGVLLWRRRSVLCFVLVVGTTTIGGAAVLAWSYHSVVSNPMLSHLAE